MSEDTLTTSAASTIPKSRLNDIHVNAEEVLITPNALREELPLPESWSCFCQKCT